MRRTRSAAAQDEKRVLRPIWRAELADHVVGLSWSGDSRLVAAAAVSGAVAVFDGATGALRWRAKAHEVGTCALALRPQGDLLATAGQDGVIRLFDADGGAVKAELPGGAPWVEHLAWSPSGELLLSAAGRLVRLWRADGSLVLSLPETDYTVSAIRWQPGRAAFAVATYGAVNVFEGSEPRIHRRFAWKGSMLTLEWSPSGRFLATGNQDASVHLFIVATGKDLEMAGYATKVRELSWDPTSRFLATGGGEVPTVWDFSGKGPAGTKPLQLDGHRANVSGLAFQHTGPVLASGGEDGALLLWAPTQDAEPRARAALGSAVSQLAWAPDDQSIAVGSAEGRIAAYRGVV